MRFLLTPLQRNGCASLASNLDRTRPCNNHVLNTLSSIYAYAAASESCPSAPELTPSGPARFHTALVSSRLTPLWNGTPHNPSPVFSLHRHHQSRRVLHKDATPASASTLPPHLNPVSPALRDHLASLLPGRVSSARDVLLSHGRDESYHTPLPPDLVVFPETTAEVSAVLAACHAARVPVVPYGAGTSVEGHVGALAGGVCVDTGRMRRVLGVNEADMDCRVEAGVTRQQLAGALRGSGLFFPCDPGADASLGGMAATRASGTNAVRYGTMREAVLGLTAVLADGSVLRTGTRARKSAAGYDLTGLLVGSEGTLGLITEVSLRLHPVPEATAAAVCAFPEPAPHSPSPGPGPGGLRGCVEAVAALMAAGAPLARVELLDALSVAAVNRHQGTRLVEEPTLFFEFHGSPAAVREQAEAARAMAAEHGGSDFRWADTQEERDKLWKARHTAYWAAIALRPGCKGFPTDVCVPLSRLTECVMQSQEDAKRAGLVAPMVGHVGDGNFHAMLIVDPASAAEVEAARGVVGRMVARALRMEGTCTGEHGIGHGKLPYLLAQHGPAGLRAMAAVKRALDPRGVLNPGKLGSDPAALEALAAAAGDYGQAE